MAIAKDVVKTKFNAKFVKVNAPKTLRESLINKIADKVKDDEDETNLDNILEMYEPVLIESAKEIDKGRTEILKLKTQIVPTIETEQEDVMEPLPLDTPEYIKVMMKQLTATQNELKELKTAKTTDSLSERFNKDPRVSKIPDFMKLGHIPKTEEEFETKIEALAGAYTKFAQDNKIAAIGEDVTGGGAGGKETVNDKVIEAATKQWADAKIAAAKPFEAKV